MTLVLGVYPDPLLTPLTGYVQSMFEGDASVLPIPHSSRASDGSDVPVKSNTLVPSISLGGGTDENDENADIEKDHIGQSQYYAGKYQQIALYYFGG